MTREDWLTQLTDLLRDGFVDPGVETPQHVRATRGWPNRSARAKKSQRSGQCWSDED